MAAMTKLFESNDWATCSSCGSARNRGDRCEYCGKVYVDVIHQKQSTGKAFLKSLSSKYQVEREAGELRISWRWGGMRSAILLVFFAIWNGMLYSVDYGFGEDRSLWETLWSLFPIPAIHMLVGLIGPLYVITRMINRTTINANRETLSITHHPIPWGKRHRFAASEIEQIYISKTHRSSKERSWEVPELQLVTKSGVRHRLLKGKKSVDFSDYEMLSEQLSNALNIR